MTRPATVVRGGASECGGVMLYLTLIAGVCPSCYFVRLFAVSAFCVSTFYSWKFSGGSSAEAVVRPRSCVTAFRRGSGSRARA